MDDIKVTCINPACDDETDHLWINLQKSVYHCWKCGYAGKITENKKILDILKQRKRVKPAVRSNNFVTEKLVVDSLTLIDTKIFMPIESLKPNHQALKYIHSRGVTTAACAELGGMYCPNGNMYGRLVFPIKSSGKIVGWQGRSVYNRTPKYIIFGRKSLGMYNRIPLQEYERFAIIFEGIFDVLKVPDFGISILGKKISKVQLRMLSTFLKVKTVFVMLDSDANLDEMVLAKQLGKYFTTIPIQLSSGDPGNLTELQILSKCVNKLK